MQIEQRITIKASRNKRNCMQLIFSKIGRHDLVLCCPVFGVRFDGTVVKFHSYLVNHTGLRLIVKFSDTFVKSTLAGLSYIFELRKTTIQYIMTVTTMDKNVSSVEEQKSNTRSGLMGLIKPQQQRILLLHHASLCSASGSSCTVTQHCDNMKKLWCHVSQCKTDDCTVQHCDSSKRVLTHYSKCIGPSCLVCVPVRKRIKEGYCHRRRSPDISEMVECKRQKLSAESSPGSCCASSE